MGTYTCPACRTPFIIDRKLLERPLYISLPSKMPEAFDAATRAAGLKPSKGRRLASLDFECSGCGSPVRLFYEYSEVHMGTFSFRILAIIELVAT
jgi:hypothetical protein